MWRYSLILLLSTLLLVGCSSTGKRTAIWTPSETWWEQHQAQDVEVHFPDGRVRLVRGGDLYNLRQAFLQVSPHTVVQARLALIDEEGINAFAWSDEQGEFVALTLDALHRLGLDQEALANLLGHELAHLELAHGAARAERANNAAAASTVLGVLAGSVIPFGGTVVDLTTHAVVSAYSRDDERAADVRGMQLASSAGYSPCGMLRVGAAIKEDTGGSAGGFFSTHPGTDERMSTAEEQARAAGFTRCD